MLIDHEMELTDDGGETFTGTFRGQKPLDLKAAGVDPAVGEKLSAFVQVLGADVAALTSLDVEVMTDTDGAGGTEVSVLKKNFLLAALTKAKGLQRVGIISPNTITKQFLTAKFTVNGANNNAATAKLKLVLMKGDDVVPQNKGRSI